MELTEKKCLASNYANSIQTKKIQNDSFKFHKNIIYVPLLLKLKKLQHSKKIIFSELIKPKKTLANYTK